MTENTGKKKLLIVGGDSFIAQQFYSTYKRMYEFYAVSRKESLFEREIVCSDFQQINEDVFSGMDAVINFAAIVHNPSAPDDLYETVNYQLAVKLAEKAKQSGVSYFIQMSTIAVYGDATEIKAGTKEQPVNAYGRSKAKADDVLQKMQSEKFWVSIIRPPMVYGGNGKAPGNMARLVQLTQKPFPLPFKNIDNKRDFIHVGNLIQCLKILVDKKMQGIYLPKDKQAYSTETIVQEIADLRGGKARLFAIPGFMIEILKKVKPTIFDRLFGNKLMYTQPELEKLGYQPKYSLREGLKEMMK